MPKKPLAIYRCVHKASLKASCNTIRIWTQKPSNRNAEQSDEDSQCQKVFLFTGLILIYIVR